MIFSKYNYLFNSTKYGFFIFNSRTNSFFKIDKELYESLEFIKESKLSPNNLNKETQIAFKKAKILVDEMDDENFQNQKKYIKYKKCLSNSNLGIVIAPTLACNFACPYCYESDLPPNKIKISIQNKIVDFIESFNGVDTVNLTWHGGEPLLAFDAMENILSQIFKSEKISIGQHNLVTNGYLLNKKICNILKDYKLDYVQITIDGIEETHNQSRIHKSGIPTYQKILENIDSALLILVGTHINIRVNIHKKNAEDFPKLYRELSDRWKNKNITISPSFTTDHGGCKVKCLKHSERVGFYRDLYFNHNIKNINFYLTRKSVACTADFDNTFIIGPEGELYKCWVDLGKEDRVIGTIFSSDFNQNILAEYMMGTDMFNDSKCKECVLFPLCDGGCNLFRYEHKLYGTEYNVCPIDINDLATLLELHYEQQLKINE